MNKNLYKFLSIALLSLFLFNSCKKNADVVNPGISYGIVGIEPAMAASGDTVTVYGIGFQASVAGNSIKINGVDAKIIAATTTTLSVVIPQAPRSGNVSVQTGSQSFTFNQAFSIATVLSGSLTGTISLTQNNLYLLRGEVHVTKGSVLSIPAGTVILAEKLSLASLIVDDGGTITANGTMASPVVFTSNQPQGLRAPGDWKGITLSSSTSGAASDVLNYVRIEYAGYHLPDVPGAALLIDRGTGSKSLQFIQSSYSAGDGFRSNVIGTGTVEYLKYLLAFGCAGNDFDFAGDSRIIAQFLVGLKDPLYADQFGSDGLLVQSSQPVTISNLTLMGPDGLARNTVVNKPSYFANENYDDILNPHGGRGVHIGGYNFVTGASLNGTLNLFNSVIAAPWLAGISVDGPQAWNNYGNGTTGSIVKYTSVTYTLATSFNTFNHDNPPIRGYSFSVENQAGATSGFASTANTPQGASFNRYNDTLKLQLETPFLQATNPNATYDELGLSNLALYSRITNPLMTPASASELLNSAIFSDPQLGDSYIDKTTTFRGAFGVTDWTKPWSNYVPQQTSYN